MSDTIESLLEEGRTFPPPADFKRDALAVDAEIYDAANADFEGFWARQADDLLDWYEDWDTILEWDLPFAKWFVGGKLNARTTASIATSRRATAARSRTTGSANRATPVPSRTRSCSTTCAASPTP